MNNIRRKKICGFSILEALIATSVASVGMLGLAQLQGVTLLSSSESRLRTNALNLAQEKIEDLRSFANKSNYDALSSGQNDSSQSSMAGGGANFTRIWTMTNCTHGLKCQQVNVSVGWTDSQGATQNVELTSFIAASDPVKSGLVLESASVAGYTAQVAKDQIIEHDRVIQASSDYSQAQKAASALATIEAISAFSAGNTAIVMAQAGTVQAIFDKPEGRVMVTLSIIGSIIDAEGVPIVTITDGTHLGGCVAVSPTEYECHIETTQNATLLINADANNGSVSCTLDSEATLGCALHFVALGGCQFAGNIIAEGDSVIAYQTAVVGVDESCLSEARMCLQGTLLGHYFYAGCTQSGV